MIAYTLVYLVLAVIEGAVPHLRAPWRRPVRGTGDHADKPEDALLEFAY